MTPRPPRVAVSRRTFLRTGSAAGAALVIGFRLSDWTADAQTRAAAPTPTSPFDAWVRVATDGTVTLVLAKSEMGQGVMTALPMILAEELDIPWNRVHVEQALTNAAIYNHGTGGSTSVRTSFTMLREAGAAARQMLVAAAAAGWRVDPATCTTSQGVVLHAASGRRAEYGALVGAASKLPVPDPKTLTLKDPAHFTLIGTPVMRADIPSKVDGSARFGIDTSVPGMLYAVVARCPTIGGKARRFDAAKARAVAGVRDVFEIPPSDDAHSPGGIAVVATSTWAAISGRNALVVDWDSGPNAAESTESLRAQFAELARTPGKVVRNDGDALKALASGARTIRAVYELPFQAHATMEPMNCTVAVRADSAEAWVPSQSPQGAQTVIAAIAGLPASKVTVHTTLLGGGFGRRALSDFVAEAALVSKAAKAPVKLVWTREDDIQHDFYRQSAYHAFEGALDADGRPVAWFDRMISTSIAAMYFGGRGPEGTEISGAQDLAYDIPNIRMEYQAAKCAVPVWFWRSVEHSINGFAVESFVDELAHAAGKDPLAFRLALLEMPRRVPPDSATALDTTRFRAVLERVAASAGWGKSPAPGHHLGLAAIYGFQTYVAQIAEVSVEKGGKIRVHRVVTAVDCGRVINPNIVAAQMESGTIYGLSAALKGAITVRNGQVEQSNFDSFPVIRIDEAPLVETHIVESSAPPTGTGEPATAPVAAAVANAIFAATGKRIRRLPIRPEDLAASAGDPRATDGGPAV